MGNKRRKNKSNNNKYKIKGQEMWYCNYNGCNKIYFDYRIFNRHHRKHNKLYKCSFDEICNKSFSNPRDLSIHEKIHNGLKEEKCKFCFKKFIHPSNLKKHIKYLHSNSSDSLILNRFICRKCNKSFNRKESLQKHLQSHLKRDSRKLIHCETCNKSFTTTTNCNRHKRQFNH